MVISKKFVERWQGRACNPELYLLCAELFLK
jgi:hypothetical protein